MSQPASPTGLSTTAEVIPITQVGALSQAWYDALGLQYRNARPQAPAKQVAAAAPAAKAPEAAPAKRALSPFEIAQRNELAALQRKPGHTTVARARLLTPRQMKRTAVKAGVHPPQPDVFRTSSGRITIISRRGVVRLLLQRNGASMRATAVCDPRIAGAVADALSTTRMHLAARGLAFTGTTHSEYGS